MQVKNMVDYTPIYNLPTMLVSFALSLKLLFLSVLINNSLSPVLYSEGSLLVRQKQQCFYFLLILS